MWFYLCGHWVSKYSSPWLAAGISESDIAGHPEIVFILINAGLSATHKDSFSQTPLHSACIKGDIQCAEMLMKHVS
jgi:ankyrin repeat protein